MIAGLAVILASLAKVMPTFAQLGDLLYKTYAVYRKSQNQANSDTLATRDNAAIAAARAMPGLSGPSLCADCPFAGQTNGQHRGVTLTPAVPGGGTGGA